MKVHKHTIQQYNTGATVESAAVKLSTGLWVAGWRNSVSYGATEKEALLELCNELTRRSEWPNEPPDAREAEEAAYDTAFTLAAQLSDELHRQLIGDDWK